jgi:hypothetical protein
MLCGGSFSAACRKGQASSLCSPESKRAENSFARDRRSRVKLRDASDGAADRKIKNEKERAAARSFP